MGWWRNGKCALDSGSSVLTAVIKLLCKKTTPVVLPTTEECKEIWQSLALGRGTFNL